MPVSILNSQRSEKRLSRIHVVLCPVPKETMFQPFSWSALPYFEGVVANKRLNRMFCKNLLLLNFKQNIKSASSACETVDAVAAACQWSLPPVNNPDTCYPLLTPSDIDRPLQTPAVPRGALRTQGPSWLHSAKWKHAKNNNCTSKFVFSFFLSSFSPFWVWWQSGITDRLNAKYGEYREW